MRKQRGRMVPGNSKQPTPANPSLPQHHQLAPLFRRGASKPTGGEAASMVSCDDTGSSQRLTGDITVQGNGQNQDRHSQLSQGGHQLGLRFPHLPMLCMYRSCHTRDPSTARSANRRNKTLVFASIRHGTDHSAHREDCRTVFFSCADVVKEFLRHPVAQAEDARIFHMWSGCAATCTWKRSQKKTERIQSPIQVWTHTASKPEVAFLEMKVTKSEERNGTVGHRGRCRENSVEKLALQPRNGLMKTDEKQKKLSVTQSKKARRGSSKNVAPSFKYRVTSAPRAP